MQCERLLDVLLQLLHQCLDAGAGLGVKVVVLAAPGEGDALHGDAVPGMAVPGGVWCAVRGAREAGVCARAQRVGGCDGAVRDVWENC